MKIINELNDQRNEPLKYSIGKTVAGHSTLLKEGLIKALDTQMTTGRTQHA